MPEIGSKDELNVSIIGGYSHPEGINVAETAYLFFKRFFDGLLKILPNRIIVSIFGSFSQIVDIFSSIGSILYI